ncbi:hypothetical protein ABZ297_10645 [Nonomuraea sp. NPDC005983]|uniref:RNA polymerase sigma factor n=1 Tax=Nonomuraea sp. NPDC005983 TaxID=3155595 RepID=UPI0033A8CE05
MRGLTQVAVITDAALIEESMADPERFACLFDRYADEIHRYATRRLGQQNVSAADDVTAETFLAAFRKRSAMTCPDWTPRPGCTASPPT